MTIAPLAALQNSSASDALAACRHALPPAQAPHGAVQVVQYVPVPGMPHAAAAAHVQYVHPHGMQQPSVPAPFAPFAHMQAPGFAQAPPLQGTYMHAPPHGAHMAVMQQPHSIQQMPAAQRPPGPRPPPTMPP